MFEFKLKTDGVKLKQLENSDITTNGAGIAKCVFCFDSAWDGLVKTAMFYTKNGAIAIKLDNDTCLVPTDAMVDNVVSVGVIGINTDGVRLPSTMIKLYLLDGAVIETDNIPSPTLWEQYVLQMEQVIATSNEYNNSCAQLKQNVIDAKEAVDEQVNAFDAKVTAAQSTAADLMTKTNVGNTAKDNLVTATSTANTAKTNLQNATSVANTAKTNLETATAAANISKTNADTAKENLEAATNAANTAKTNLNTAKTNAETSLSNLNTAINTSATSKTNLEGTISDASTAKSQLQTVINSADTIKGQLSTVITQANTANGILQSLTAENTSAASNLEQLRSENFNSQEILAGVADIRAYLGLSDADILGVQVDYKNKTFTRIAGATNLTGGSDFDPFTMYGGRKRCNVADDGTINAYYGDEGYTEDGSNGQVMVYQHKFYYLVCPVVYDPIETGIGYHLRKANYYVSSKARAGFRLHPAFYDAAGNPVDYILLSAYEGCIWDADGGESGTGAYILNDAHVMSPTADKFCSIAGAKPASGLTQDLTRPKIEQMAQNRGTGWHGDLIKAESANQLLMIIEMGMMNMQTAIGQGVVSITDNTAYNCSSLTGSTTSLGNATGSAASTTNEIDGTETAYTTAGKVAITYRGMENPWGNIWKHVYGINFYGNGNMGGGQPYICSNFAFAESKNTDNYVGAGFTIENVAGYISAMGYSTSCDWLFIASETLGNSSLPVGDYTYITQNLNGYRIALLGGGWLYGGYAGGFYWDAGSSVGARTRSVGGRLVYVPTATV